MAERLMSELMYRSFPLPAVHPMQHPDYVYAAIFSPDGRYLVTTCRDNNARIWDTTTGKPVGRALEHDRSVIRDNLYRTGDVPLFAVFSPDGRYIATASADKTARVWEARTGAPVGPALPHNTAVISVQFTPDGKRVATGSDSGQIRIWDVPSGVLLLQPAKHSDSVNALCFSPDGSRLATGSDDTSAAVWDTTTGQRRCQFTRHQGAIKSIGFSPDARKLITGSLDGTAQVWDAETGKRIFPPLQHSSQVFWAAFSPDGLWAVTASYDKTACLWDAQSGARHGSPLAHNGTVRFAEFSPNGQRVVTASEDRTARVWDLRTAQPLTEPMPHGGEVRSARFSPEGTQVATASADGTAVVWDVRDSRALPEPFRDKVRVRHAEFSPDGRRFLVLASQVTVWQSATLRAMPGAILRDSGTATNLIHSARFSPDGARIVTASVDHTARIWSAATLEQLAQPVRHSQSVNSAEFSPDGRWIATAAADHTARVWDSVTAQPISPSLPHADIVYSARFSPAGRKIITASADRTARIWDAQSGVALCPPLSHSDGLVSACFSADGQWVVTASRDNTARVWSAATGLPMGRPIRHEGPVLAAVFSPDSRLVATASADETAGLWEVSRGAPAIEPLKHDGPVRSVQFSRDSRRLLTASLDGSARVWDARTGQPLSPPLLHDKRLVFAHLSPDERWALTACYDWAARLWRLPALTEPAPPWLADLAESVAGQQLDATRTLKRVLASAVLGWRTRLAALDDQNEYGQWATWFLADRESRRIAPSSPLSVEDYVNRRVAEATPDSIRDAARAGPSNGLVAARMASLALHKSATNAVADLWQADWLTQRAVALSSDDPEVWWTRGEILEALGNLQLLGLAPHLDHPHREAIAAFSRGLELAQTRNSFNQEAYHRALFKRSELQYRRISTVDATVSRLLARRIPLRHPDLPASLVDLSEQYNASLDESWVNRNEPAEIGNNLARLPKGRQKFGEIEFDIRGVVQLSSRRLARLIPSYPKEIAGIKIGTRARRVHFLHASDWGSPNSRLQTIGSYTLNFADGHKQEIPIVFSRDMLSWCDYQGKTLRVPTRGAIAWNGTNSYGLQTILYQSSYPVSRTDARLESVDFRSQMTVAAPLLIAITVEP